MSTPPCVDECTDRVIVSPDDVIVGSVNIDAKCVKFCGTNTMLRNVCTELTNSYDECDCDDDFMSDVSDLVGLFSHRVEEMHNVTDSGDVIDSEMNQVIGLY